MGAEITFGSNYVEAKADRLKGAKIYLDYPSVGATENLVIAASLADGTTVLENVAEEPEDSRPCELSQQNGRKDKGRGH